jgi:hypothetical protein
MPTIDSQQRWHSNRNSRNAGTVIPETLLCLLWYVLPRLKVRCLADLCILDISERRKSTMMPLP